MTDYSINLTIQSIWTVSRVIIDIAIMWFVLYYAMRFVRNNSRTTQIFKGIILILVINGLAKILGLTTVTYFSDMFINWGFLAVIIIFQPEIRGLLERIGKTNAFSRINTLLSNEKEKLVDEVLKAVLVLSEERVGALISLEQSQSMQDYIKTGIEINSAVSKELITSVFMTTTPLHDGAVIIQGDRIACASAYFPPTNAELPSRYGARHRAALGISEVTDALTIVVSEETSVISIAEKGKIFAVDEKQLRDYLRRVICNDEIEIRESTKQRSSLFLMDEPEVIIDKSEDEGTNLFSSLFKSNKTKKTKNNKKVENTSLENDMKVPRNNRNKQAKAQNKTNAVVKEEDVIEITDKITINDEATLEIETGGNDHDEK